METLFIVLFVIFVIYLLAKISESFKYNASTPEQPNKPNEPKVYTIHERVSNGGINVGSYLTGHPQIDTHTDDVYLYMDNHIISIYTMAAKYPPRVVKLGEIPYSAVSNVSIEDSSTIEKRVTLGRVLLTGVFALAWKKKKIKESAFIVIDWTDGKFRHETTFAFNGEGALNKANKARNGIILLVK